MKRSLRSLVRRRRAVELGYDQADRREVERLSAEYTSSWGRNAGQELGMVPGRYGRERDRP